MHCEVVQAVFLVHKRKMSDGCCNRHLECEGISVPKYTRELPPYGGRTLKRGTISSLLSVPRYQMLYLVAWWYILSSSLRCKSAIRGLDALFFCMPVRTYTTKIQFKSAMLSSGCSCNRYAARHLSAAKELRLVCLPHEINSRQINERNNG